MKQVDRQLLVSCCEIPCAWQTEGAVEECPHRSTATGPGERGFPKAICRLYSTPGPHAESKIALKLGVSVSMVRRVQEVATRSLARELSGDMALSHDDRYMLMMEGHLGSRHEYP